MTVTCRPLLTPVSTAGVTVSSGPRVTPAADSTPPTVVWSVGVDVAGSAPTARVTVGSVVMVMAAPAVIGSDAAGLTR